MIKRYQTKEDMKNNRKLIIFVGIIVVFTIFVLLLGVRYGYSKGVGTALDWYEKEYIKKNCKCWGKYTPQEEFYLPLENNIGKNNLDYK